MTFEDFLILEERKITFAKQNNVSINDMRKMGMHDYANWKKGIC